MKTTNQILEPLFVIHSLALQLKDKHFNEPCFAYYDNKEKLRILKTDMLGFPYQNNMDIGCIIAPTYQQVANWLMDKHNIWIACDRYFNAYGWYFRITNTETSSNSGHPGTFDSQQLAYAFAVEYVLTTLIK
jgi:hypothetical protein